MCFVHCMMYMNCLLCLCLDKYKDVHCCHVFNCEWFIFPSLYNYICFVIVLCDCIIWLDCVLCEVAAYCCIDCIGRAVWVCLLHVWCVMIYIVVCVMIVVFHMLCSVWWVFCLYVLCVNLFCVNVCLMMLCCMLKYIVLFCRFDMSLHICAAGRLLCVVLLIYKHCCVSNVYRKIVFVVCLCSDCNIECELVKLFVESRVLSVHCVCSIVVVVLVCGLCVMSCV